MFKRFFNRLTSCNEENIAQTQNAYRYTFFIYRWFGTFQMILVNGYKHFEEINKLNKLLTFLIEQLLILNVSSSFCWIEFLRLPNIHHRIGGFQYKIQEILKKIIITWNFVGSMYYNKQTWFHWRRKNLD